MKKEDLQPQYIINEAGEKTSVILSLSAFQELMEDIEDLAMVAERRDEPTVPHEQLVAELKKDGLIFPQVIQAVPSARAAREELPT